MATIEDFFDLRIATIGPGEPVPAGPHLVRIEDPPLREVRRRTAEGWHYKPCWVTYVMEVPLSLEDYVARQFRAGTRNKPRKLLREVPARYRLEIDEGARRLPEFADLYRRTVVARPRGKDRLAEHTDGFGTDWEGLYLRADGAMAAGILVHRSADHLSVAYGAFDPGRRELDLEHYLIMQCLERARGRGLPWLSLGMDTNRYGHHLSLGLPAYKLRLGFTPLAVESGGRELAKFQRWDVFEEGLFFWAYGEGGLVGEHFGRGAPDLRPFRHHTAPPVRVHRLD